MINIFKKGHLFFLTLIIRFFDKKLSLLSTAILSALIFSFFNGGSWLGLPLFGGLIIIIFTLAGFLFIDDFKSIGYIADYKLLNAKEFGIPQNRERLIYIGVKKNFLKNVLRCFDDIKF